MSSSTNTIINPKACTYGCNTRIYWDTSESAYLKVFTKKRHSCPNRSKPAVTQTTTAKPNYYNNKFAKQPKPKMSNSFELLTGPIDSIQKNYEILSDIVIEYNGRVHGSQSNINGNNITLIVYFEVPEGKRDDVKQKYNTSTRNTIILQQRS